MALLLYLFVLVIIAMLLVFYFMRTSVELPKTWPQFKTEVQFIFGGIRGCAQDIALTFRNKICEYGELYLVFKMFKNCFLTCK